jgi:hypothetical protein
MFDDDWFTGKGKRGSWTDSFIDSLRKERETAQDENTVKKKREEEKQKQIQATQQGNNAIQNIAGAVGGFASGVAEGIAAPFKRTGEGIAEVINEVTGGAAAERQAAEQQQTQSIELIKSLGQKMRSATSEEEKNRYREAIRKISGISDQQYKDFQARQNQIIERTDPVKGAAAVGELGLNVITGGTVGAAVKGASAASKATNVAQKLITPTGVKQGIASGAIQGAAYGATSTAQQMGTDATAMDYASGIGIGAVTGGALGGVVPAVANKLRERKRIINDTDTINDKSIKKVNSSIGTIIEKLAEPVLQSDAGLRTRDMFTKVKVKLVRSEEPILRVLRRGERKGILPEGRTRQIETLIRDVKTAEQQAEYYMRGNQNWTNVISGLGNKDLDKMAKYAEARAELDLINRGVKKDAGRAKQFEEVLADAPEDFAQRYDGLVNYYSDLRERLVDAGIVSREQADMWAKQDPGYIHIQRELDSVTSQPREGRGGIASIKKSKTEQKRGESIAETKNLLQVAIVRTQQLEREILRNKAANALIDNLGQLDDSVIRQIKPDEKIANRPTIARRVNGLEETYETLPEIEAAAKSWDAVPLGAVGRAMAFPTRVLRSTLTGPLNPAFILKSAVRDPIESFTMSRNALATHSPQNIIGSLADAAGKNDLFQEYLRTEGSSTLTDVLRKPKNAAKALREQARLTKPSLSRKAEIIKTPSEWFRKLEDVTRMQEQLSRYQNFRGAYNDAINRGASRESALIEARWAARNNMVDFYQTGDWSKVLNTIYPYFNASLQGGVRIARAFKEKPVATSAKIIAAVQVPTVLTTMYNLSDPRRAEIYMDMPEYERENNWIFVLPNSKKVDGRWEVVKIPKPPGVGNFSRPVEKMTASMYGHDPAGFMDFVQSVISAGSPFNTSSGSGLVGSLIPQQIKPFVQDAANYDFFTGKQIVPDWLSEAQPDPFSQHFDNTSATAKEIAGWLGVSPLRVDKFIKSTLGEGGQNALFGIDSAMSSLGTAEGVGGRSLADSATRSFTSASGGERQMALKEAFSSALNDRSSVSEGITEALKSGDIAGANQLASEYNARLLNVNVLADGELATLTDNQKTLLKKLKFPLQNGELSESSIKSRLKN